MTIFLDKLLPFVLMQRGQTLSIHFSIASIEKALRNIRYEHYCATRRAENNWNLFPNIATPYPDDIWLSDGVGKKLCSIDFNRYYHNSFLSWPWDGDNRPRGAAIPGTGKRGNFRFFRRPQTQNVRRQSYFIADEDEPILNGRSAPRGLPTSWEDLPRRAYYDRSWKKFRRTQWRGE